MPSDYGKPSIHYNTIEKNYNIDTLISGATDEISL